MTTHDDSRLPAILGGPARFPDPVGFAQPTIEEPEAVLAEIESAIRSGVLTNGPVTRRLEQATAELFQVDHCVAVSSCTAGLMLVLQALDLDGPVAVPSFTFSATAHAVRWNGLPLRFADCDPATWCLDPEQLPDDVAAVVGVHVSGVPCDVAALEKEAERRGVPLLFDAAHGTGAAMSVDGALRPLGSSGVAEVFSLTPTKPLNGAEGGLVATNDAGIADLIRIGRDYGNPGDYDTRFHGLNARMSELHAAVALQGVAHLAARVDHRTNIARIYHEVLGGVPGIRFQQSRPGDRPSYKDFTILVDHDEFGCSRDAVAAALAAEGVDTRLYYSPPVHRQHAYRDAGHVDLPVTDVIAEQVLTLPMSSHLPVPVAEGIGEAIHRISSHADRIRSLHTA